MMTKQVNNTSNYIVFFSVKKSILKAPEIDGPCAQEVFDFVLFVG